MYDNIFTHIAVFLFNATPYVVAIVFALFILNFVRTRLVAARKRAALKKNAAAAAPKGFDPFAPITFN